MKYFVILIELVTLLSISGCFSEVIPKGEYYSDETKEILWIKEDGVIRFHVKNSNNQNKFEYGETNKYYSQISHNFLKRLFFGKV